jgi:hypothetical protein
MGALFIPNAPNAMHRDGAIKRCSEINRWQLRVHAGRKCVARRDETGTSVRARPLS